MHSSRQQQEKGSGLLTPSADSVLWQNYKCAIHTLARPTHSPTNKALSPRCLAEAVLHGGALCTHRIWPELNTSHRTLRPATDSKSSLKTWCPAASFTSTAIVSKPTAFKHLLSLQDPAKSSTATQALSVPTSGLLPSGVLLTVAEKSSVHGAELTPEQPQKTRAGSQAEQQQTEKRAPTPKGQAQWQDASRRHQTQTVHRRKQLAEAKAQKPQWRQQSAQRQQRMPDRQTAPQGMREAQPHQTGISCCTHARRGQGYRTSCRCNPFPHCNPTRVCQVSRLHPCARLRSKQTGPHPCSGPNASTQPAQQSA